MPKVAQLALDEEVEATVAHVALTTGMDQGQVPWVALVEEALLQRNEQGFRYPVPANRPPDRP